MGFAADVAFRRLFHQLILSLRVKTVSMLDSLYYQSDVSYEFGMGTVLPSKLS